MEEKIKQLEAANAALTEENKKLKAEIADYRELAAATQLPEAIEKAVREKVRAGLTREQALEVVRSQALWDEEQKKTAKASK